MAQTTGPDNNHPDVAAFASMLRIRLAEEAIADRYQEQEMRCPVHLSVGQEASAVGVCAALTTEDRMYSTHRCHAHYLAKGGGLKAMLAEIYGKAEGCIGGRGGSMHLAAPEVGLMSSVPIVASAIPLAAGAALSDKLDGNGRVTVSFIGDACVEEGVFHETANFARLHDLPVIFACENNLYSVYTRLDERQPNRPLTDLAQAHGIPSEHVDGNDVAQVRAATARAVDRARNGEGPTFLLLDTYRWREHCGPNYDNHIGYRTEAEFEQWRALDPIERTRAVLFDAGLVDDESLSQMNADFEREIDQAFDFAKSAPLPDPASASVSVYAE
jgi:TPP-dependent pyruvate/acetoin dehydrogenase alpha subunit